MNEESMVTISKKEYDQLVDDSFFLNCLRNAGVDNWDGFEFTLDEFLEDEDES
jgi:hypothetical protein